MRKLLNVLYITTEDAYLSLDGENVVVNLPEDEKRPFPLHLLESIVSFSNRGASPALLGKCREYNIRISFYTPFGKYLASVGNSNNGNVYLRRTQYRIADDNSKSLEIAKNLIEGKLYNSKYVLLRFTRDHKLQVDTEKLKNAADSLQQSMKDVTNVGSVESLRGIEGNAAASYFSVFDELILRNKEYFVFNERNRRPPTDRVNAMLSFSYTLLANECSNALNSVGLDPYVGFLHTDCPGRESLALDLMEELRPVYADRFVLTLINSREINSSDFVTQDNGAVYFTDDGKKKFLSEWQKRKKEEIRHPYLEEKISWGLVPYIQALLMARYLRGDLDGYPPFFWK